MAVGSNAAIVMKEIEKAFTFSSDDLRKIVLNFHAEMQRGLKGKNSSLKMLPAFVDCPTGREKGRFFALDLGGTNLRILQVRLKGNGSAKVECAASIKIPKSKMTGKGKELFDFLAQKIQAFLAGADVKKGLRVHLGFTFSFPVRQTAINKGILILWTKGFSASSVEGKDVVQLLSKALLRNKVIGVEITALTNDTVGTMLAKSYAADDCDAGVIFGTGTNCCYRESLSAFGKRTGRNGEGFMVVNTEWGNFNLLPLNTYDTQLDRKTINPSSQQLEKMISGMYLGELARLVIKDLIRQGIILKKHRTKFRKGSLTTKNMALLEGDSSQPLDVIKAYLKEKGIQKSTFQERKIIKQVCRIITRRAARISGTAISAVVTWMDPELSRRHTVAIDGSLYKRHPRFRQNVRKSLHELHGEKSKQIRLAPVKDGSGVGGAVAAAIALQV